VKSYLPALADAERSVLAERLFREGVVEEIDGKLKY